MCNAKTYLCDFCCVAHKSVLGTQDHGVPHICKVVHGKSDQLVPVRAVVNALQGCFVRILYRLKGLEGVQIPQPDGAVM